MVNVIIANGKWMICIKEQGEMVHVKRCPYGKRGKPSTEFYKNDKPQIYCLGWVDKKTDDPLLICRECDDWVHGNRCEQDFNERKTDETD